MRLIDADKLEQDGYMLVRTYQKDKTTMVREMKKLSEIPSAEPEWKKGKWINRSLNIVYPEWERYKCSACGGFSHSYEFCPHCGADMRGEQDE